MQRERLNSVPKAKVIDEAILNHGSSVEDNEAVEYDDDDVYSGEYNNSLYYED